MTIGDKWKQFASSSQGQKAGDLYKKTETGVWRLLDPVGKGANKLAGKAGAEGFWPGELGEGEIDKAARILKTFTLQGAQADADPSADSNGGVIKTQLPEEKKQAAVDATKTQKVIKKIPESALQGACGVAIFTCFRTGFGFSGSGGSGVVVARLPDGSWSPPSGILIHTIGWGLLIGLDVYDVVLILRTKKALQAFENPKISLGGELSVAAGPVGNGAVLDAGVEASPCWSYTKSKGAYAGLQLDGTIVLKRDDANGRFYGTNPSVADIFQNRVIAPKKSIAPLIQTLYAAEGRPEVMGTQMIPDGMTPGDAIITEEDAKEMEAFQKQHQEQWEQGGITPTEADQGKLGHEKHPAPYVPLSARAHPATSARSSGHSTPTKTPTHRVPPPLPPRYDDVPAASHAPPPIPPHVTSHEPSSIPVHPPSIPPHPPHPPHITPQVVPQVTPEDKPCVPPHVIDQVPSSIPPYISPSQNPFSDENA